MSVAEGVPREVQEQDEGVQLAPLELEVCRKSLSVLQTAHSQSWQFLELEMNNQIAKHKY